MAYQRNNFQAYLPQISDYVPMNAFADYMQGYQMGKIPEQLQQKAELGELQNQSEQLKQALIEAQTANQLRQAQYGHLTGPAAEAYSLEQLRKSADPRTIELAEALMRNRQQNQESLIQSRNLLNDTAYKRASTMLGKTAQELDEIKQGFMPGSNGTMRIDNPELQQKLLNQYELKLNKETTDTATRQKTLFANNIDKTLGMINVDALAKYSGPQGKAKLLADQAASLTGPAPKDFLKYQDAIIQAQTLAKQYRQTFGDSVSPRVLDAINDLTNPTDFFTSPEVAKSKFKALEELLKAETKTFKGALQSTKEYEDSEASNEQQEQMTQEDIEYTARLYGMTPEQVIAELEKRRK